MLPNYSCDERGSRRFDARRIEVYPLSSLEQSACLKALGGTLQLAAGEPILTEISRKLTPCRLDSTLSAAGSA